MIDRAQFKNKRRGDGSQHANWRMSRAWNQWWIRAANLIMALCYCRTIGISILPIRMNLVQEVQRIIAASTLPFKCPIGRRADDRLRPHLKEPSWKELARFFPSRVTYAEISSYLLYKCVYHRATVCSYLSRCGTEDRIRMSIHLQNEEIFV